ncbi:cysteine-rich receptor-like protein kinase [Tanacetum coccineum]
MISQTEGDLPRDIHSSVEVLRVMIKKVDPHGFEGYLKMVVEKEGKGANDKEYDYEDKTNNNGTRVIEVVDDGTECDLMGRSIVGGLEVIIVFEIVNTATNILEDLDHGLRRWMQKLCLWDEKYRSIGREKLQVKLKRKTFTVSVIEEVGDVVEGDIVDPKQKDEEETDTVQMEEAENEDVSSEEGDENEDCGDQVYRTTNYGGRSSRWVKKLFGSEKVANENDKSGKKPAWAASEYMVSKSGICCTPTYGPKKVVHTDNIFDMNGPDGPSNANFVADENNKVDGVIDCNAGDKINNLDKIGNKEANVDNCDMNGSSAGKHGSSGKGVYKKRKKSLNGSFEGVMKASAVSSGKDDAKVSSGKKNRRRSFNLLKAGTRWKSSHSSSNGLGCNVNSLDVDTNEKGRGSVKTNVMGPTCSVSKDRLKKIISINIRGLGVEGKKGWVMSIIRGEKPDVIALQETKSGLVDDFWVEEVWDNRNFGFIAVKGGWKGVSDGQKFTRTSDDGLKFSKLDRFLVSEGFKNKWGNLSTVALDRKLSDHCPIVLKDMDVDFGPKPFRVFNICLKEADIENRFGGLNEKINKYSKEAMRWELEAESRALDDEERLKWLEARFSEQLVSRPQLSGNGLPHISSDDTNMLEKPVEEKEVWDDVISCGGDKAPRPDGLDFTFIKRFWDVFKKDMIDAIKWFWDRKEISRVCNSLFVTLIPKVADPIGLGEYRPISLIGEVQNAFIGDRFILDGILIANETVDFVKKNKSKGLIFKVDFKKAYDSINWRYLCTILRGMGFGEKWCSWIDTCLKSSSMSVTVNGSSTIELGLEHGVRQGDPLSPFLYILAAQGLNSMVKEAIQKGCLVLSIYGESGGLEADGVGSRMGRSGIWRDIIKEDGWVGDIRLSERFPRLFQLDRRKEARVVDRGRWCEGVWRWEWDWGLVALEFSQDEDDNFKVKDLAFILDDVCLRDRRKPPSTGRNGSSIPQVADFSDGIVLRLAVFVSLHFGLHQMLYYKGYGRRCSLGTCSSLLVSLPVVCPIMVLCLCSAAVGIYLFLLSGCLTASGSDCLQDQFGSE